MNKIGVRIKRRRELLNLQMNDLSKKVGISSSALSQIENGKAHPSIITLKSIADNLHTTIGELVGDNEPGWNNFVVRKKEMQLIEKNESGAEIYHLSHHETYKHMDTFLIKFNLNSDLQKLTLNLVGEIFCYIISGQLTFELEGNNHEIHAGDSVYFNANMKYSIKNQGNTTSEIIWVATPPMF